MCTTTRSLRRNSQASGDEPPPIALLVEWIAAMGRDQRSFFLPILRPLGYRCIRTEGVCDDAPKTRDDRRCTHMHGQSASVLILLGPRCSLCSGRTIDSQYDAGASLLPLFTQVRGR